MISKSTRAKRRRNAEFYKLVRRIHVVLVWSRPEKACVLRVYVPYEDRQCFLETDYQRLHKTYQDALALCRKHSRGDL